MFVEITLIFTNLQVQLVTGNVKRDNIPQLAGALLLPVFVDHEKRATVYYC
jgi:hypothetical protein